MPLRVIPGKHGSPNYYLRGTVRGRRVEESTGTSDKEAAEAIRIKREAEELDRSIHGDEASRTFAEAALSYMKAGGETDFIAPILGVIGKTKLSKIGQHQIDHVADRLKPGASNATINRQIYTPISAVLHHAAAKGWCTRPLIKRPKQPQGRIRWITQEEADRLLGAAAPHLKPLVIFLLSTGARLSEALYLEWRDVDLHAKRVQFVPTEVRGIKNDSPRGVPLHARAIEALEAVPWEKTGFVFRRPAGKIKTTGRVWLPYESRGGDGGGQIKTAWKGMLKRAGISDFTPHDCRHTWATWHYKANRDLLGLQQLGGWKSLKMVERYAHVNADNLAPSINAMWEKSGEDAISKPDTDLNKQD